MMNAPMQPDCPHWRTLKPGEAVTTTITPQLTCPQCEQDELIQRLKSALAWYADYGAGAATEPKVLPSHGVALGMLQHDGGRRAREALESG
jgi:hypothetical protein